MPAKFAPELYVGFQVAAAGHLMTARGWEVECLLSQWFNRLGLMWDDDRDGNS